MGRSALAGVGSCLQKGPALSDIHQFVRIAQIKRLNSNCVLVLMFHLISEKCATAAELKGKSAVVQRRRLCTTNSFPPMLEKSDHSESDRKLIQAHWRAGGILVVIHPNPKHYNSCMA